MKTQQIEKAKELLYKNPNGLTIDIKTAKPKKHKTGFYIGLTDNKNRNIDFLFNKCLYEIKHKFKSDKGLYLGFWLDEKTNISYLDIATHTFNIDIAFLIAKHFKQKAIYSIKENKTIYV